MIVVVSAPEDIPDEVARIHALFESGLRIFHLRKPNASMLQVASILKAIRPEFRGRVALHHHHELAEKFGVNRLHFTEQFRKSLPDYSWNSYSNKILSTSIHSKEEFYRLPSCFDYTFLGPVFDSISKQNYPALKNSDRWIERHENSIKVIGIGGIDSENAREVLHYGFDGIALLGSIWNYANGLDEYKRICMKCPTIAQ
jgi:thiamine-phosphate pyrophosphorylase